MRSYYTRIWHEKFMFQNPFTGKVINVNTGRTFYVLWEGDDRYMGISYCSKKDKFSKKQGLMIAQGRALKGKAAGVKEHKSQNFTTFLNFNIKGEIPKMNIPEWLYLSKEDRDGGSKNSESSNSASNIGVEKSSESDSSS